jgi:ectoine hydroxylase-related dioxygenase (phytanoyl-CoA dioxygenase family)
MKAMITTTAATPRLSEKQVDFYHQEGYLLYQQPVLSPEKFQGLKDCFEKLLTNLPAHVRPESMDVPHFICPELFKWLFDEEVLALVEPILGPDIALFSSHFICKPPGIGKRVPWHEDSAYWRDMVQPMDICTLWLAIDPSTTENGCMWVIPKTNSGGYSDYEQVDQAKNVFPSEIISAQRDTGRAVPCVLQPNEGSLHHAKTMHGSPANTSTMRRCGYTMRYMSTRTKFDEKKYSLHQIYLAQGQDLAGNVYGDPTKKYDQMSIDRIKQGKTGH